MATSIFGFIFLAAILALPLWVILLLTRRPETADDWRIAGTSRLI